MTTYDAIVIGAGVAGLTAAGELRRAGWRVLTLEARDRIGGRAFTDVSTFARPFDLGCHWLHGAERNPFKRVADRHGFTYASGVHDLGIYAGAARLARAREEEIRAFIRRTDDSIRLAARLPGRDVSVADFIDWTHPAAPHYVAAFVAKNGTDPAHASSLDWGRYEAFGDDRPIKEGYGELIRQSLGDVPVALRTPVTSVDWSGRVVRVGTPDGTVEAPRVLLTVSTGVLAAQAIAFRPDLPAWKRSAIEGLPMGSAIKIGMEFSTDVFGVPETSLVSYVAGNGTTMDFEVRPFGWNGVVCYLDGELARRLEKEGGRAAERIALEGLCSIFGSAVAAGFLSALQTNWETDPLTRGAYTNALPGRAEARAEIGRPVEDRLYFAGEAAAVECGGDVHGAHLSGFAAVREMLAGSRH